MAQTTHPGGSFAAEGPHADRICAPQPLSPPHGPDSPVGRVHDLGGQVLLLGVTHSEDTTLHLAESIARAVVAVALEHLDADPLVFLCPRGSGCEECDAAHASVA